jgi:hypothetical protein
VIEGQAPIEVVNGNAQYVSLRNKSVPFDLKANTGP